MNSLRFRFHGGLSGYKLRLLARGKDIAGVALNVHCGVRIVFSGGVYWSPRDVAVPANKRQLTVLVNDFTTQPLCYGVRAINLSD